jgi:hypothetical protein
MKLQGDILIPDAKLTQYLLAYRDHDDKSKWLAQVGFTQNNPDRLAASLLELIQTYDAVEDRSNKYGTFYRVEGNLRGLSGDLAVIAIWLKRTQDQIIQFITLKPKK